MEFFNKPINKEIYSYPGLSVVECVITNNFLYGESENVYASLSQIYSELQRGTFENEILQRDFRLYGESCFDFDPIDCSEELEDSDICQKRLKEL